VDHQDPPVAGSQPSPRTATGFDAEFATVSGSPGVRRVWQQASPDLPSEIEPYSFVSIALLGHMADVLALSPGRTLVELGCGRGGPGLWLAQSRGARLIGVDFSGVAVQQATDRAGLFGLADRARFLVGDLAATGLGDAAADAVVSIDALHFAADPTAAAREAWRLLRPGGRRVLTNWQPRNPADMGLPSRLRIDWTQTLHAAGFVEVRVESRPEWHELFTRVFRVALELGDPGEDLGLASLQDEARQALPQAELVDRVVGIATRPDRRPASRSTGR